MGNSKSHVILFHSCPQTFFQQRPCIHWACPHTAFIISTRKVPCILLALGVVFNFRCAINVFSRLNSPNSFSLSSIAEVFQPSNHFCGPPLDLLQQLHVFPVLRAPEMDSGLQVGSHQSRVEGQNHLPQPAGHTSLDAALDAVGPLGCQHTLPGHLELLVKQHPQVFLLKAALNPFSAQPVFVLGIALTHMQDLALGFFKFMRFTQAHL